MADTTYPGVYVKEDQSLSMSIGSGATAVPVFVFEPLIVAKEILDKPTFTNLIPAGGVIKKFNGWLDYAKFYKSALTEINLTQKITFNVTSKSVIKDHSKITSQKILDDITYSIEDMAGDSTTALGTLKNYRKQKEALGYFALQHYFENGGGPCYVYFYSSDKPEGFNYSGLTQLVKENPDITLVVLAADDKTNVNIHGAIDELLTQSIGHSAPLFCLAGVSTTKGSFPEGHSAQTAAYYPKLKTNYVNTFVPDVDQIAIKGYTKYIYTPSAASSISNGSTASGNTQYHTPNPQAEALSFSDWEIKMSAAEKEIAALEGEKGGKSKEGKQDEAHKLELTISAARLALAELAKTKPLSKEDVLATEQQRELQVAHTKSLMDEIAVIEKIISATADNVEHAKVAAEAATTLQTLKKIAEDHHAVLEQAATPSTAEETAAELKDEKEWNEQQAAAKLNKTQEDAAQQQSAEQQDPEKEKSEGNYFDDTSKAVAPQASVKGREITTYAELKEVDPKMAQSIMENFQVISQNLITTVYLSPVAAVAGAYCLTDTLRGVWKAPANVVLKGVTGLVDSDNKEVVITDTKNKEFMTSGINPIRFFPGKGYTIWGARTMVEETNKNWLYVPVRRLFNIAERDIKEAMARAVFEPNTPATWETLRSAVDSYLHNLWKQGALFGDSPEQAYFVQIGLGATMTQVDIEAGKLIIKVGMSAVRPAEFIMLEFSQKQI